MGKAQIAPQGAPWYTLMGKAQIASPEAPWYTLHGFGLRQAAEISDLGG